MPAAGMMELRHVGLPVTIVLGASPDPARYAYRAVRSLLRHGHGVVAVGRREGIIDGVPIVKDLPVGLPIDTVTVYLSPANLATWLDRLVELRPRRVIFNPGAEDPRSAAHLRAHGIEVVEACTLVLLSVGGY